jgi:hypothetical protein
VVVAVVLLLVGAGVAAFALGLGPAPGGGDDDSDVGPIPTETPSSTDDTNETADAEGDSGGDVESTTPPFTVSIDQISSCGTTCRDVTATLTNQQPEPAEDVTVFTQIYVGNSTAAADRIWEGSQSLGTIPAGASVTRTQRVSLSYAEAYSVQQHDGWVTVVTTIQSTDRTVTVEERRDVT